MFVATELYTVLKSDTVIQQFALSTFTVIKLYHIQSEHCNLTVCVINVHCNQTLPQLTVCVISVHCNQTLHIQTQHCNSSLHYQRSLYHKQTQQTHDKEDLKNI